jgi:hypothetical protein
MAPFPTTLSHRRRAKGAIGAGLTALFLVLAGCGDDDDGNAGPTNTGRPCASADECYPGVMDGELLGEAVCLDRVEGGYCTHECTQDSDCCGVEGECEHDYAEVCAPLESMPGMHCFLSCEDDDWQKTTAADGDAYCQAYASAFFHCRSTGGGADNRKVCLPDG